MLMLQIADPDPVGQINRIRLLRPEKIVLFIMLKIIMLDIDGVPEILELDTSAEPGCTISRTGRRRITMLYL